METETGSLYELFSHGEVKGQKAILLGEGRLLIGSSESSDVVLPFEDVSAIHAVLVISKNAYKIFDMNSKSGTFVNEEKVVSKDIRINDVLKFGNNNFTFKEYVKEDIPPVLEMLSAEEQCKKEEGGDSSKLPDMPDMLDDSDIELNEKAYATKKIRTVPGTKYPLGKDPKAEYSEYIFEDASQLFPIFKYKKNKESIEVIILYGERVYSVDYLPKKNTTYYLKGKGQSKDEIEYVYLQRKEKFPLIKIENKEVFVNVLQGYKGTSLGEIQPKTSGSTIKLHKNDILRLTKNDHQIFVRTTETPPRVSSPPITGRDRDLNKYLVLMFLLITSFLVAMTFYKVDKELVKEKNPERIATILYKKVKQREAPTKQIIKEIKKTKLVKKSEKVQKIEKKKIVKKIDEKAKVVVTKRKEIKRPKKSVAKTDKKSKVKKVAKATKLKVTKKVVAKKRKKVREPRKTKGVAGRRKSISKSRGKVDVYRSANFASSVNNLLAKGSSKGVKAVNVSTDTGLPSIAGGGTEGVKRAKVAGRVGSFTKGASGVLDSSQSFTGIVRKKGIQTVGILSRTVVMGSMDPEIIRKILMDHLPQFRFCYEDVLNQSVKTGGVLPAQFTIGASGHVAVAGFYEKVNFPAKMKRCVIRVLKGIKFPSPLGGGKVTVNQPMNFRRK